MLIQTFRPDRQGYRRLLVNHVFSKAITWVEYQEVSRKYQEISNEMCVNSRNIKKIENSRQKSLTRKARKARNLRNQAHSRICFSIRYNTFL